MTGLYRTLVADPPWPFHWQGSTGGRRANATKLGYEPMSYDRIKAIGLEVREVAMADATLLLWTTQEALHAGQAQSVARCWDFTERIGEVIWRKPNFGTGDFPRIGHETCIIYRRGVGSLRADRPRNAHSVQTWSQPRAANNGGKIHSAKPDGFYDLVESGFAGLYAELFARRARFGWSYPIGDQALGGVAA